MSRSTETGASSLAPIYRRIFAYPPLDWIMLAIDLVPYLYRFITRERYNGLYEILEYDTMLELHDTNGETALFKKRQRVKFLQDNVIAIPDFAWGEGQIFASYKCSPGKVVDYYQQGDRWNILISLRETKGRGDIEDFYIERVVQHGFRQSDEWWQIEVRHPTKHLKLSLIFPHQRQCQRAVIVKRSRHKSTVLGSEHISHLPDGRQIVTWETKNINRLEVYTLKWQW